MQDYIDQVIVKVAPNLRRLVNKDACMSYIVIRNFKDFSNQYFKKSPSAFFIDNEFY